ncbi:MAG: HAD hydrolase-like protein [Methanocellales archaeon]
MRENPRFCLADYIDLAIFADNLQIKSKKYEKPHPMGWMILKSILSTASGLTTESSYILREFKNLIMKKVLDSKLIPRLRKIAPSISEENAVYIGDSLSDLEFAENAGIRFIAIATGRSTWEEFKNKGASFIASSHMQLIDIISNLGIKIIIFDFDGTLVNHFPARYKAYCDFLELINKKLKEIELRKLDYDNFREILRIRGFGKLPQATVAALLVAKGFIEMDELREISRQYYSSGKTKLIAEVLNSASQRMKENVEIKTFKEIFKMDEYFQLQIDDNWEHPSHFFIYSDVPLMLKQLYPNHIICLYSSRTEKVSRVLLNSDLRIQT